jgi:hypothetical protein
MITQLDHLRELVVAAHHKMERLQEADVNSVPAEFETLILQLMDCIGLYDEHYSERRPTEDMRETMERVDRDTYYESRGNKKRKTDHNI